MKKTNERQAKTRVVFRAFSNGEIIALFPDESTHGGFIGSYMHEGQHGDASRDVVGITKPATREQYAELYKELVRIGYCLEVGKRIPMKQRKTYQERKEEARQEAIEWQLNDSDYPYSYEGIAMVGDYFNKLGKRYGLLREFRENAIPC